MACNTMGDIWSRRVPTAASTFRTSEDHTPYIAISCHEVPVWSVSLQLVYRETGGGGFLGLDERHSRVVTSSSDELIGQDVGGGGKQRWVGL